jgi:hypothetical protein
MAQCVDQQGERWRRLPAARVVEVVAWKGRTPVGEHPDEPSIGEVRLHLILGQVRNTQPGHGRVHSQGDVVEDQLPFDTHLQLAPAFLEFPGVEAAVSRQTKSDAVVGSQVLRRLRPRPSREVGRRPDDPMRKSGPMRTAIISLATCSPRRTPAS